MLDTSSSKMDWSASAARLETDRQDISVLHEAKIHVDHIWGETSLKFNVQVCFICLNKFYCKFPSAVTKWLMFMHTLLFPQINLDKNFGLSYPVSWHWYSMQKNCVQIEWDFREIWTAQIYSKILYFIGSILKSEFIKAMLAQWTKPYMRSRCQDIFIFLTSSIFYFMLLSSYRTGRMSSDF